MKKMRKNVITITALLIVVFGGIVFAEEPDVWSNPKNMSGSVWLTTDYVFRGLSNSNEDRQFKGAWTIRSRDSMEEYGDLTLALPMLASRLITTPVTPGRLGSSTMT